MSPRADASMARGWLPRAGKALLLKSCLVLLGGCAAGPDFVSPQAPDASRYTRDPAIGPTVAADGMAQRFAPGAELPLAWWRLLGSAALDATVQRALVNSPTLQSAEASLRQSQDNLRAGDGLFYPQVVAGVGAARERGATDQRSTAQTSVFNVLTASGNIGYVLDVFGGERRAVENLQAQVDIQRFLARAAYVTLSANVVDAWIARAAYVAEARATEQLIALEVDQLTSTEAQVRAGTSPYANVLSQRALIAANRALLASLRQRISQAGHLLALLEGDLPANAALPDTELSSLTLPLDLPLSLPSELVHQRPDILAAEARLHAASARIGVATAALFPSFSLSAGYGAAGSSLGNLLGAAGRFWSIGPSIAAPLFNGGSLRAQRQSAIDAFDVQQADYRQTVLVAFGQVADALRALEHDAEALQAQAEARQAASDALTLLRANYRAGLVAYVDVLSAEVQLQVATIAYLQAVGQRHQDTVALFVALGGGWWNAPGDTPRARVDGPATVGLAP